MNYYRITFTNYGETFAYGDTALEAIDTARADLTEYMTRTNLTAVQLDTATARRAVYSEWECTTASYTLDGSHTHKEVY